MQVCGLIKCAGLWADILLRLTQIQTVGIAMLRLLCYVLHNSVAKPGGCTCFTYLCLASTKRLVDGQNSSPEIACFLSEALL